MKGKLSVCTAVLLVLTTPAIATQPSETKHTEWGTIEYAVTYDFDEEEISIQVTNNGSKTESDYFYLIVDKLYKHREAFTLESGETRSYSFSISKGLNIAKDKHRVRFEGSDTPLWFNFTKDIDPTSTEEYPVPRITNISLKANVQNGETLTRIHVVAYNPAGRYWTPVIRAHTLDSTGHYGILSMAPHSHGNASIILNESAGELISGEVRMYAGNFSSGDGAFDQVEILGRSSGSVEWSHEEYEVVKAPWETDDYYVYENKSTHRQKIGAPETAAESPVVWAVAIVALLVVVRKIRRFRG